MVKLNYDDILAANTEAIVNTVNCVGVMGKGIALQFKMKYPDNYAFYKKACDQGRMIVGKVLVFERSLAEHPKYIINFPTKRHWKGKSTIEDIRKGLHSLIDEVERRQIKSIAIPGLGSGLGGLNWDEVKLLIIDSFSNLPEVDVQIYEPHFVPAVEAIVANTQKPKLTLTKALLIKLMQIYQVLGYPHSLLEIQKLMYFINVLLGKKLKFNFVRSSYGPYTNTINHLLQNMENHFTRGYGDRSQKAEIRLMEGAIEEADNFFSNHIEYLEEIDRIQQLVDGFETPFGMELLSTTHWVATEECIQVLSRNEIISKIHQWNARKKQLFQPHHINVAINRLEEEKWIQVSSF